MTAQAYPLQWPEGWPRTRDCDKQDSKYRFKKNRGYGNGSSFWTFAEARDALVTELERLGARNAVLSSNYELRLDGLPRGGARTPFDTGIAIYFVLKGKQMVMACDMHLRAEENMRSLALAIEAMRQLERHGGGTMMERAFTGFMALPSPGQKPARTWREVLNLDGVSHPTAEQIREHYRLSARSAHPDAGGSVEAMAELNAARDAALREIGA